MQTYKTSPLITDLLNVALELLVANRQGVEELLQADGGALLSGLRGLLHQVAFVVKHQLGAHLSGFMARHHTQAARAGGRRKVYMMERW